jgi:hypothetical protein
MAAVVVLVELPPVESKRMDGRFKQRTSSWGRDIMVGRGRQKRFRLRVSQSRVKLRACHLKCDAFLTAETPTDSDIR